ncbi:hypothetical protein JW960_11610 [candidate division KSB1 bacterium]|nr:hypothetical protein [candidate division KSB1 bacterium]
MRRIISIFILIGFVHMLFPRLVLHAQVKDGKVKVAVLEFDFTGISPIIGNEVTDRFRKEIEKCNQYYVMSRSYVQDVIREKLPNRAGPISELDEIKAVGQAIDTDLVIAGTVGKVADAYVITVKLIDLKTNEVRDEFGRLQGTLVEFLDQTVAQVAEKLMHCQPQTPIFPPMESYNTPWYKKWYTYAAGGTIALVMAIVLLNGKDEKKPASEELPGPPNFPTN